MVTPILDTGEMSDDLDYGDDLENLGDDANENGANADEDTSEPVLTKKQLEAMLTEREKTFSDQYKGLQRSIGAKDREILELRRNLESTGGNVEDASEAFQWVAEQLLAALPDDARKSAELAFRERTAKVATRRLESARNRQSESTGGGDDGPMPEWMRERIQKFINVARKSATRAGVDPDDKSLDYGGDDEGLVERLERFENSLEKAQAASKNTRVDRVRQKQEPVATRTSGGGAASGATVPTADPLRAGAAKRLADMRAGKYG